MELRYVDYRGKRLLYRAHIPMLNVKYDGDACGPYLDWQDQEGMLQAPGTNVGSGSRLCPAPAKTVLDNGQDADVTISRERTALTRWRRGTRARLSLLTLVALVLTPRAASGFTQT